MKISDLVSFHNENFFEGAVQLRWLAERPEQAKQAANAFVFHGPHYHGAASAEVDGFDGDYRLKDSASFVRELLGSIEKGLQGEEQNPYWLVVAGYGSGKSHLALTCSTLLAEPTSETSKHIVDNVIKADQQLGHEVRDAVNANEKPALVITLDGMSGFHLGNALTQATLAQLHQHGIDTGAISALSPRFQLATQFVERNFAFRASRFADQLPGMDEQAIYDQLRNNNEEIYNTVDELYSEANGSRIPVMGQESAQELLNTLCEVYCGTGGSFSNVVIMFDEFGRYLEYAAEKPLLAGDSALQQIFQGVQDNSNKIRFVGFIQYELKAYLKRFGSADLRQLQRYITRFDSAKKWYLSTNLETLFAHMIGKKQSLLDDIWSETESNNNNEVARQLMGRALPGYLRFPVWTDPDKFSRVIAKGCWPLHPLATWFLTRQRDVVQSRSALTFIKEMIDRVGPENAVVDGRLRQVSAAELVLQSMLPEMIAAERETGGMVAETLQLLLEKFKTHINSEQRLALAGVAILERMRVGKLDLGQMNRLLAQACAMPLEQLEVVVSGLSKDLGAIEWNQDLGQYELIVDASTRGQFQQWLRLQQAGLTNDIVHDLFMRRGGLDMGLEALLPTPDFAQRNEISTPDWQFKYQLAHSQNLDKVISSAFRDWRDASLPTDPKGHVIYLYIKPDQNLDEIDARVSVVMKREAGAAKVAPVWVIGLNDANAKIVGHLSKLYLFDEKIAEADRERFRRFVPEEKTRSGMALKEAVLDAVKQKLFWIAGVSEAPEGKLKQIGSAIFEGVYPKVVPFSFDGFASGTTGAADCAQITKSLISKQVNITWVQTQPKRLQNRVTNLLAHTWGCLRSTGQLAEPSDQRVKAAYELIIELHQHDPDRTLKDSFEVLLAPPYGMNAASAELMIGLLVGLETPPRRIELSRQMVTTGDWVSKVFPAQKGKHYLDQAILSKSTIRFLSEDATGRWRQLLDKWEGEEQYENIISLTHETEINLQSDPLPEALEGRYFVLLERAKEVRAKVQTEESKLNKWEQSLEGAEKRGSVGTLLWVGSSLLHQYSKFEKEGCWPSKLTKDNQALSLLVTEFVGKRVNDWLPRQACNSIIQVGEYNQKIAKQVSSLKELGFTSQSERLENQARESVAQIEERDKHRTILDRSNDYPSQPLPTESTPVRSIRDDIATGDALIEGVKRTQPALKLEEIDSRIAAIKSFQEQLRVCLRRHTNALGGIFSHPITGHVDLEEILVKVTRLQDIFVGTPDAQEVQDLKVQVELIKADSAAWDSQGVSVERLAQLLKKQSEEQLLRLNAYFEEYEIDPAWDTEVLYETLINEKLEAAQKRSSDWLAPRVHLLNDIPKLDLAASTEFQKELDSAPVYLADSDREKVNQFLAVLSSHCNHLKEVLRKKRVNTWLADFEGVQQIDGLSKQKIEQLLKSLRSPPDEAKPEELSMVSEFESRLTAHLDQMGLEDIIGRIENLPIELQHQLLALLVERRKPA